MWSNVFLFSVDLGIVPIDTGVRSQGWAASGSTKSRSINRRILAEPAVVLGGLAVPSMLGRNGQGLSGTGVRPHADVAPRFGYFSGLLARCILVSLPALVACPPSATGHPPCGVLFPGRKSCYPLLLPEGGVGPPVTSRAGQTKTPRTWDGEVCILYIDCESKSEWQGGDAPGDWYG